MGNNGYHRHYSLEELKEAQYAPPPSRTKTYRDKSRKPDKEYRCYDWRWCEKEGRWILVNILYIDTGFACGQEETNYQTKNMLGRPEI